MASVERQRHGLHADRAQVADVHFQTAAGVEVAQFHVGDAAVGILQRVFGIVGHHVPILIEHVAALLGHQEGDDVAAAVGAGAHAEPADELLVGEVQLVPGQKLAVQPHFGQGVPVIDDQQPRRAVLFVQTRMLPGDFNSAHFHSGASFSRAGRLGWPGFGLGTACSCLTTRFGPGSGPSGGSSGDSTHTVA